MLLVVAAVVLTSCIGTISRQDFEEEIRSRGGGFRQELVLEVVADLEGRLGSDDLSVGLLSVTPSSATVVVEVRDPAAPANLDRYVYHRGDLTSAEPVRLSASDDLDAETVPLSALALDRLDEMVDAALGEYGVAGAYVDGIHLLVLPGPEGQPTETFIVIGLESARSSADATFTASGELVGVELR